MEFWIGIILDTICLAIALFIDQPKRICKRHEVSVGTTDKNLPDRGNHRGDHSGYIPDEPGSDTGIRR